MAEKRGRGRPKTKGPKSIKLDNRFYCCAANYIAQVYQCKSHSIRTEAQIKRDAKSPVGDFITGDCFIWTSELIGDRWIEGPYHDGLVIHSDNIVKIDAMSWHEAAVLARKLHAAADIDRRFGVLDGANRKIVYANEAVQVLFEPDISSIMPFIIYHPGWAKIFRDGRGVYRTFRHLSGAIEAADKEAAKLKG